MSLEKAEAFSNRGSAVRMARAVRQVMALRPPCARCMRRDATRVIDSSGTPQAVCSDCGDSARLDARVARQREQREAMRGRRA